MESMCFLSEISKWFRKKFTVLEVMFFVYDSDLNFITSYIYDYAVENSLSKYIRVATKCIVDYCFNSMVISSRKLELGRILFPLSFIGNLNIIYHCFLEKSARITF